ncbi:MAG TPA: serine hydrolase domain-containing protein [Azospirillaceae bacterium]|nr:serine hydrolase domain-containing protein [Azospirillaceae bacterium]
MGQVVERLQAAAETWVGQLGNVGVLIGIDIPGREVVHVCAGHADRECRRTAGPQHLYQIGSQTKMMTTMAGLILERQGRLSRQDRVATLLDRPDIHPDVTVEHLMMNSSGLGEFTECLITPWFRGDAHLTPGDLVAMGLSQGQLFKPGERFDYCNTGFVLLALILERVSGRPYHEVLAEEIFQPLGMRETYVGSTGHWPRERMASGYFRSRSVATPLDTGVCRDVAWAYGTGDVISSLADMRRYGRALLDPANPTGISLREMTAKRAFPSHAPKFALTLGAEYGIGIERACWAGRPVWGHRGGTLGYGSATWIDEEAGIVVTTCVTGVRDITEPLDLQSLRYPGAQLFTLTLATAYQLAGL